MKVPLLKNTPYRAPSISGIPFLWSMLSVILFGMISNSAWAEGSKDFVTYPGYRMFLDTRDDQQLKVYADEGETINVGSSHVGIQGGFINVYDPDGNLVATFDNTGTSTGLAIIDNSVEEMEGPTGGGTTMGAGYEPGVITVPAGQGGVWTVIFDYPSYTNAGFTNILNNFAWTRAANQPNARRVVLAWDITVTTGAAGNEGGAVTEGRVYSNEYISLINGNNAGVTTSPTFYVLTEDGYLYQVNIGNANPFRFPISSNSLGLVDGTLNPIYKSKPENEFIRDNDPTTWDANSLYLFEPQAEDNGVLINNKIFFNVPDPSMPSTSMVTDFSPQIPNPHQTWLMNELDTLSLDTTYIAGYSGTGVPCAPGTIEFEKGGWFYFQTNLGGSITLQLDLDNNGSYNDPVDVNLMGVLANGLDSIFWDGNDGLGNPIAVQDSFMFNYQGTIRFGELHIALTDVEGLPAVDSMSGVTFKWLNAPAGYPTDQFYYDHSDIGGPVSGGGTPGNALPTTTPYTYPLSEGNDRYIDQWFFIEFEINSSPAIVDVVIDCVCANGNPELTTTGGDVCEEEAIVLTATNATTDIGDLTYVWSGPNGYSFTETIGELGTSTANVASAATLVDAGVYTVIASNSNGCADTVEITVGVNLLPTINAITGGGEYCEGDDVTLVTANISAGLLDVTTYQWTGPGLNEPPGTVTGTADITLTIPSILEAGEGTYSISMTSQQGCDGGPFTVDVIVNPTPVLTTNQSSASVCENDDVQFCATNTATSVVTMSCVWTGPNGFFSQSTINGTDDICLDLTNVSEAMEGTYTLVCSVGNCDSDPLEFTLDVQPTPEINGISPTGDFCVGDDVTLTAQNVTPNTGDLNYTWFDSNGDPIFTGTAPEAGPFEYTITNIQLGDAGEYTLILETQAGCQSVAQTTTIGVLTTPIVCNVTGGGDACVGQDVTLSAFNCAADVLPVTYSWTAPSGAVVLTGTASDDGPYELVLTSVDANDSGTYTITITSDLTGCTSETVEVNLNVLPGLVVTDVTPDSNYCEGATVVLTATATIATGMVNYEWTGPNGQVCANTVNAGDPLTCEIIGVTEGDEGDYILNVFTDEGCTYGPDTVFVGVFPTANIVDVSGGGNYCDADTVFLNGSGMGTAASVDWEWTSPSGEVVGAGTSIPAGPFPGEDPTGEAGVYTLTITTPDGCTDSESVTVELGCTPIAEILFGDTTLCELDTLTLCGQNLNPDCGPIDYTWLTPNGIPIVGASNGTDVFCDEILPLATYGTGYYYLFLNSGGCSSLADSVLVTLNPNPVISEIMGGGVFCEGDTAKLTFWNTNPAVDSFFYTCNLPGGLQVTDTAATGDTICIFITEPGFVFCSLESFEGCVSSLNGTEVIFNEGYDVTATSNSPICSNETLELNGSNSLPCTGDANYTWTDPNGDVIFSGTAPCEGPFPASLNDPISGEYCLVVFSDSSSCADTACIDVEVLAAPELTSGIDGGGEFCEGEGTSLTAVVEKPGGGDLDYTWTLDGTAVESGTVASGETITLDLSDLTVDDSGEYCLEVICPATDCSIDPIPCTTVTVSPTPFIDEVSGAGTYCEGVDVPLNGMGAQGPGDVTYTWSGPNFDFTGTAPCGGPYPADITNIQQNQGGVYTLTVDKNGCVADTSIIVEVNPTPDITLTIEGPDCAGEEATLTATIDPDGAASVDWTLTGPGLDESGTVTELTTLTFTVIPGDGDTYTLTATSDQGCEADPVQASASVPTIPTPTLTASPNPLCPGDELQLTTQEQAGTDVSYCWYRNGELLATTTDPVFDILDPLAGDYTVQAKVDGCDSTSDPVTVSVIPAPDAVDDSYNTTAGQDVGGNVTDNDSPNTGVTVSIVSGPSNGTVILNADGSFTYTPNEGFAGTDEFTYQICLDACQDVCDEATVTITVDPDECIVPNIISPNGDGVNDVLFINCVPISPNNSLRIFNRWGDEIYVAEPYNNDWDGTEDGEAVPVSTYFYLFYSDRDKEDTQMAGYIRVVR